MSLYESYALSPKNNRYQRVADIDAQESSMLEQIHSLQIERSAILQTLGVTALSQEPTVSLVRALAETA